MKNINLLKSSFAIVFFCCVSIMHLHAIKATTRPVEVAQPDGTSLTVRLKGDEFFRYKTTLDGRVIFQNEEGYYVYGVLDNSGNLIPGEERVTASSSMLKSSAEPLFFSPTQLESAVEKRMERTSLYEKNLQSFRAGMKAKALRANANLGNNHFLLILVEFSDLSFKNTAADFNGMLNGVDSEYNYTYNGATGSLRKYYSDNSKGSFVPTVDVYGPIKVSRPYSYYGGNDSSGDDKAPQELLQEALNILFTQQPDIDLSIYDMDGDKYVDACGMIYAGYNEAEGGPANTIWPHQWSLSDGVTNRAVTKGGYTVDDYFCTSELSGSSGSIRCGIGTCTHEFGHAIGLPDFYDTAYSDKYLTPELWDLMDYGSYNNNGNTPPNLSTYERYFLGFMNPRILDSQTNISLNSLSKNDGCIFYAGNGSDQNEYFTLENRQQTGWDAYLPGHGMLIYHIDRTSKVISQWNNNTLNNTAHQCCDLEEADGISSINQSDLNNTGWGKTPSNRAGDPFPGKSNKTSFTDTTTPNSKSWYTGNTNKPITNIKEAGGVVTFDFMGSALDGDIVPGLTLKTSKADQIKSNSAILYGNMLLSEVGGEKTTDVVNFTSTAGWTLTGATTTTDNSLKQTFLVFSNNTHAAVAPQSPGVITNIYFKYAGTTSTTGTTNCTLYISGSVNGSSYTQISSIELPRIYPDLQEASIPVDANLNYRYIKFTFNKVTGTNGRITNFYLTYLDGSSSEPLVITEQGFVYGTAQIPTIENASSVILPSIQEGDFSSEIVGLDQETTYYARTYVKYESGTKPAYSNQISFKTIVSTGLNGISSDGTVYAVANKGNVVLYNLSLPTDVEIYTSSGMLLKRINNVVSGQLIPVDGYKGLILIRVNTQWLKLIL